MPFRPYTCSALRSCNAGVETGIPGLDTPKIIGYSTLDYS
jgi:hypothetical protein